MIKVTRINQKNRSSFLPAVDSMTLAVSDILLGAYDGKSDTACGVLAAESMSNEQLGSAIAIRYLFVEESMRRKGAGRALVEALMDLSAEAGADAILCSHMESEGEMDEISLLLESLEFSRTKEALPVYGFRLSEIAEAAGDTKLRCTPLKDLGAREWREFVRLEKEQSAMVNVRSYYDENISFFSYDANVGFQGALLCSRRGGVLFCDQVLALGADRTSIVEGLLSHAVSEAGKIFSPGTEIGITLQDSEQEMVLKELTEFKAEKIGSFVAHVVQ